ncbi:GNAT family N-acetyltransferase [Paenirhodobacter sp. CAU 1674]|uniref:GNAT family N-acetyltransferase n=1 Tax=Paenirhodobacter sp. CAU 1674 TaxID=3032596 RepID=UPI0023DC2FE0|nr:GNAT family N-acetyltransferase [Paenirhodobacter sp. CAU 1674]MDF2140502.1 GNAT family N-acetyltransferase [Paenirhodobacter sp. CAU 1674]
MTDPIFEVIDATWPAASTRQAGGFLVREGRGGGSRVSCASLEVPLEQADPDAAIAAQRILGQQPKFMLRPGEDALDADLEARGFELFDPVVIYAAPVAELLGEVPPVTAFAHWPPLRIARDLWADCGVGPARQAVMDRAPAPKCCVLGRKEDRAAGAAFVGIHNGIAMLHALAVLPEMRRKGLARAMMFEAARWAHENGATQMTLVVTRANAGANTLYQGLGMQPLCHYHYRREPQA